MNPKITIAAVAGLGLLLAALILRSGGHAADGHDHADEPGPAHDTAPRAASAPASGGAATVAAPRTRFSDEQLRHNGILLTAAAPARIAGGLQLQGEVQLNQDRTVSVTPRLAGRVDAVHANAGDRVQRGQVLAVISSPALAEQRADLLAARQRLALARSTHDREKRLWEDKISAEQDYLAARHALREAEIAAEAAQQKLAALGATPSDTAQNLTQLALRAPLTGVVVAKQITAGAVLKEDDAVFQVAELASVWVELAVPTHDLPQVREGMTARVRASGLDTVGEARLQYVGAVIGAQSRQATARLVLANPRGVWRPGMPVTVALQADAADVAVAVPADALQELDGTRVVFVRQGQTFEARRVQTGRTDGRLVEITQGLVPGERYAARNSFIVKADLGKAEAEHAH